MSQVTACAPVPTASLFARLTLRHWRAEPLSHAVLVTLVALGVASFLSIRLANAAAVSNFRQFANVLRSGSDFTLTHAGGRFPESDLREIRRALDDRPVHLIPVIERQVELRGTARQADESPRHVTLLALDTVAAANLAAGDEALPTRSVNDAEGAGEAVWASKRFIEEHPDGVLLGSGMTEWRAAIAGILPDRANGVTLPDDVLVTDLPALQARLGLDGWIDRVEVRVEPGRDRAGRIAEAIVVIEAAGRGRWMATNESDRIRSADTMTQAFRLNLTVLSLIALLVGLYLIRQTLEAAVVRRRTEIATLRALGVMPAELARLWFLEAAAIGFAGGLIGCGLGWLGAQAAVRAVGQTVNTLYFATAADAARMSWSDLALGVILGIGASLIAAIAPAREAARTPPAQLLAQRGLPPESKVHSRIAALLLAAAVVLAFAPGVPLSSGAKFPLAGYTAAFLAIAGAGLFANPAVRFVARMLGRRTQNSAAMRMGLSYLRRPSSRHGVAMAGLVCAVAMTAAMGIMVSSFESSVRGWINHSLRADLYANAGLINREWLPIRPDDLQVIGALPGVARVQTQFVQPIVFRGLPTQVVAVDQAQQLERGVMLWRQAPSPPKHGLPAAWISESFAKRFGCTVGERIVLPAPQRPLAVEVTGVFSDYGNERGSILIDASAFESGWGITGATHASLFIEPGTGMADVRAAILQRFPGWIVIDNSSLRSEILRIFRQTFSITYALEVIGVAVAVAGLGLTLVSLSLERASDLRTLRAIGFSRVELASLARWEGGVIALVACAIGLALSLGLGLLLVHVINRQSFGWTLQWLVPWATLGTLALAVIAAAVAVAHLTALKLRSIPADHDT